MAEREADLEFTGATTEPAGAAELIEGTAPDVLMLDLRLAGENSTQLCAALTRQFPT